MHATSGNWKNTSKAKIWRNIICTGKDGSWTAIFTLEPRSNCSYRKKDHNEFLFRYKNVRKKEIWNQIIGNEKKREKKKARRNRPSTHLCQAVWLPEDEWYHIVHRLIWKLLRLLRDHFCKVLQQLPSSMPVINKENLNMIANQSNVKLCVELMYIYHFSLQIRIICPKWNFTWLL